MPRFQKIYPFIFTTILSENPFTTLLCGNEIVKPLNTNIPMAMDENRYLSLSDF